MIEESKSKTTIIEMLVESQKKLRKDWKSTEKFEVVKRRKYWKSRCIENEPINCQNRYRPCIQMIIMSRQKTHPTATLAH